MSRSFIAIQGFDNSIAYKQFDDTTIQVKILDINKDLYNGLRF